MRKFYKNPFFDGVGPVSGIVRRDNLELRREFKDNDESNAQKPAKKGSEN